MKFSQDICIKILKYCIFAVLCVIVILNSTKIINYVRENFDDHVTETKCILYNDYLKTDSLHNIHGINENELVKFDTNTECIRCNPGTFLDVSKKKCTPCNINHYSDSYNALQCKKCDVKSFNTKPGQKSCININELETQEKPVIMNQVNGLVGVLNTIQTSNNKELEDVIQNDHNKTLDRYAELHNTNMRIENLKNSIDQIVDSLKDIKL